MKYGTFKYGTEKYGVSVTNFTLNFLENVEVVETFSRAVTFSRAITSRLSIISTILLKLNGSIITVWTKRTPATTEWEKRND